MLLDDNAKEKSAFITSFGHYQFTLMPFGMMNSLATFNRLVRKILVCHAEYPDGADDNINSLNYKGDIFFLYLVL